MAGMTREERAAYQREYRKRKRIEGRWKAGLQDITPGTDIHAACDARIADLETEIRRLTAGVNVGSLVARPPTPSMVVSRATSKPSFLAAPDDDCSVCGHDRHTYHLGVCTCPTGPKARCGCPAFVSAAEPF